MTLDIGRFRIKVRKNEDDSVHPEVWEVFSVNGESLTLPIELGDWLSRHAGEMASLIVEPVL